MTAVTQDTPAKNSPIMQAVEANEWGQITGLEPHATYFVMLKPTVAMGKERSRAVVGDVRSFLHEQRIVTEKQLQEFQEKYGEPAVAKAKELRQTMERRFDEIAKEVEARLSKLETDLSERAGAFKARKNEPQKTTSGETPGEMPTGNS